MKPMMTKKEVELVENTLLYQADLCSAQDIPLDVLEWGSGGSTVYFSRFLRDNDIEYTWTSIEYNESWHKKVSGSLLDDPYTRVVLFDCGNRRLKQRDLDMDEYVSFPATLGLEWSLILVDGRKRRRCLIEASKLLSYTGCVLLHDAQREYYHCAFEEYKWWDFLAPKLWEGRQYIPPHGS